MGNMVSYIGYHGYFGYIGYLVHHGYLGNLHMENTQPAAQSLRDIIGDDLIHPVGQAPDTSPTQMSLSPDNSDITDTISKVKV
jgi:hypothetical protein